MSLDRRIRQADRLSAEAPSLLDHVFLEARKRWKQFLRIIGVSGILDVIRESARGKAVDWIYSHLGGFGQWLVAYPFVLVTLGLAIAIGLITWRAIGQSRRSAKSTILDPTGTPYVRPPCISRKRAIGIWACAVACALFLVYGVYRYHRVSTQTLLDKYPLGYVLFDVDSESSVFPYKAHGYLDRWEFDWSPVEVHENKFQGRDVIWLTLPTMRLKNNGLLLAGNKVGGEKKVGPFDGNIVTDGTITMKAEILAVKPNGIVFLIGFQAVHGN